METASMATPFDAAAVDIANTVNRLKEYAYETIQVNYDEALRARRMETKYEKMYTVARKELVTAKAKVSEMEEALSLRDKGVELTLDRIAALEAEVFARHARIQELEAAVAARDESLKKIAELDADERPPKRFRRDTVADVTFDHVVVENGGLHYCMSDYRHPPTQTTLRVVERYRCREGAVYGTYSMYYLLAPGGAAWHRSKKAVVRALTVPNCPQQA